MEKKKTATRWNMRITTNKNDVVYLSKSIRDFLGIGDIDTAYIVILFDDDTGYWCIMPSDEGAKGARTVCRGNVACCDLRDYIRAYGNIEREQITCVEKNEENPQFIKFIGN